MGDKIVTYGMGIEIIDIKEMNKESMTLVFSRYEHTFFDYSYDRNYTKAENKVLDTLVAGQWKMDEEKVGFEKFKIHNKKEEYLYKIVDEKTIEVDLNNTKEQIAITKLDSKELILNFKGKEYQLFNELYRPADWFSEGYFCTCEKCMTELNGYDKLQGMELLKSNLNRKRTTGCFWIEGDKITKIVIPRTLD